MNPVCREGRSKGQTDMTRIFEPSSSGTLGEDPSGSISQIRALREKRMRTLSAP